MKKKQSHFRIALLIITGIFFFGFQQAVTAQTITVVNNTSCNISVNMAQMTNFTCTPCNLSGQTFIGPNDFITYNALDACGFEWWEFVSYIVWRDDFGGIISSGITFNPVFSCGTDQSGTCSYAITGDWSPGGGGAQTVELNE